MLFIEEEKEKQMEAEIELSINKDAGLIAAASGGDSQISNGPTASLRSLDSVKGGERLIEAIELVRNELNIMSKKGGVSNKDVKNQNNPILLGMTPYKFMVHEIRQIKAPDLEQALMMLPFHYVSSLLHILVDLMDESIDIEILGRCVTFLIKVHFAQISHTTDLIPVLLKLKDLLTTSLDEYRLLIGTNIAGLRFMKRQIKEDATAHFIDFSPSSTTTEIPGSKKSNNNHMNQQVKKRKPNLIS